MSTNAIVTKLKAKFDNELSTLALQYGSYKAVREYLASQGLIPNMKAWDNEPTTRDWLKDLITSYKSGAMTLEASLDF